MSHTNYSLKYVGVGKRVNAIKSRGYMHKTSRAYKIFFVCNGHIIFPKKEAILFTSIIRYEAAVKKFFPRFR